jgi:hydroxymethylpyrimidine/phosphomethylpyrimidine kinase
MKRVIPCAVTIAGSDSGGGAGIQADLKTFAALSVHGSSVLTCLTAQNPQRVLGVESCSPRILRLQLEAVFEGLRPTAVKTGMLYSAETIRAVAAFLKARQLPVVVDPVMVSTSGARLLQTAAVRALCEKLLPMATLITPNLEETGILAGNRPRSVEEMRQAARVLHGQFGCAVLIKGGHLQGLRQAVDIFYNGNEELLLSAAYVRGVRTHGTGCTCSAAVTAYLACGLPLTRAVARAKGYVTRAISRSRRVAGQWVLGW